MKMKKLIEINNMAEAFSYIDGMTEEFMEHDSVDIGFFSSMTSMKRNNCLSLLRGVLKTSFAYLAGLCIPREKRIENLFLLLGYFRYEPDSFLVMVKKHYEKDTDPVSFFPVTFKDKNISEDSISEISNTLCNKNRRKDISILDSFVDWDIARLDSEFERDAFSGIYTYYKYKYYKQTYINSGCAAEEFSKDFIDECATFLKECTPSRIKSELDRYIVGQDDAKRLIASAIYNHYLRICHPEAGIKKYNVLMIGPSGSGKTEIVRRLKDMLNIPIVLADSSGLVSTPYRGRNKEDELLHLYQEADQDLKKASYGIMFLDEFDKCCTRTGRRGLDNADELMGQFLGMMEGTDIDTSQRSGRNVFDEEIVINTDNILFVCLGSFEGLEGIVKKDMRENAINETKSAFGLAAAAVPSNYKLSSSDIELKHLIEYGIKPELAGRLCNLAVLDAPDVKMMKRILTETVDGPIQRLKNELSLDNVKLSFTDEALEKIAQKAADSGLGARALSKLLREILDDVLYNAPSLEGTGVVITEKEVKD